MEDQTELKAECWGIIYPALIFLIETGQLDNCTPNCVESIRRAVKYYHDGNKQSDPV